MGFEILNVVDQNIDNLRNQKDDLVKKTQSNARKKFNKFNFQNYSILHTPSPQKSADVFHGYSKAPGYF